MSDFENEFYGEKQLRWYQVASRNALAQSLANGLQRVCIVLPTGAGKTLTIAASMSFGPIREALGIACDRPVRVLFAAHKHRLLTQAEQTFIDSAHVEIIPHSIFSELPEKEFAKGIDVIILDEAHHEACASFQYHLELLGDYPIIGLTATPDRADGMVIKFQEIIEPMSREEAVDQGYLAPTYLNTVVDSHNKNKVEVTTKVLDTYIDEFEQTLMFFRTKKECRDVVDYLRSKGKKAIALVSDKAQVVEDALDAFNRGEIQFIANCSVISEGVDVKNCTHVVLGRAVNSYPLLNQIIGRAARPDSDCVVWEFINPLSGKNLDTTVVTGTPETHRLVSWKGGEWTERQFNYTSHRNEAQLGKENVGYH
jgi:superfamily II DNA or RNA helicase